MRGPGELEAAVMDVLWLVAGPASGPAPRALGGPAQSAGLRGALAAVRNRTRLVLNPS